jgi:hypothetical protein
MGVSAAVYDEVEAAVGLTEILLRAEGTADASVDAETRKLRAELSRPRSRAT